MPYDQHVAAIQTALAALGYDPGAIDGIYGKNTGAATDAWQAAGGRAKPANPVTPPTIAPSGNRTSDRGIAALASHEGLVPAPYKDSVGVYTYGIGHTASAGAPDPARISPAMPKGADLDEAIADCLNLFAADIESYEIAVRLKFPDGLPQHAFDGAVSFHYNTGAIGKASWTDLYKAGDMSGAERSFMQWNKPDEIIPRRKAEADLIFRGIYPDKDTPVWPTDGGYKIVWKAIRTLTPAEVVAAVKAGGAA